MDGWNTMNSFPFGAKGLFSGDHFGFRGVIFSSSVMSEVIFSFRLIETMADRKDGRSTRGRTTRQTAQAKGKAMPRVPWMKGSHWSKIPVGFQVPSTNSSVNCYGIPEQKRCPNKYWMVVVSTFFLRFHPINWRRFSLWWVELAKGWLNTLEQPR